MQVGGGPAKRSTRFSVPAAGGHGVFSVSVIPSGGRGSSAASAAVVVVESPAVVVVVDPSAVSSSPEPVRIHTPATMIPTPRRTPITVTNRRRRDDWRARTVASCSLLERACF